MITIINFVLSILICFVFLMVLGKIIKGHFWDDWKTNAVIAVFASVLSLIINA